MSEKDIVLYVDKSQLELMLYKLSEGHQSDECYNLIQYLQQAGNNKLKW